MIHQLFELFIYEVKPTCTAKNTSTVCISFYITPANVFNYIKIDESFEIKTRLKNKLYSWQLSNALTKKQFLYDSCVFILQLKSAEFCFLNFLKVTKEGKSFFLFALSMQIC